MVLRSNFLVVFLVLLSGCSYDYFIKDEFYVAQQRQVFRELCRAPDRYFVNEVVEVDGYLRSRGRGGCALGWDPILQQGFRYAECVEQDIDYEAFSVQSPVYYFTLEEKGNPKCAAANDFVFSNWVGGGRVGIKIKAYSEREYKDVIGDRCLAIDVRDYVSSRYVLDTETYFIYQDKEYTREELTQLMGGDSNRERAKGVIAASAIKVADMHSRSIVAQKKEYSFFPKGTLHRTHTVVNCDPRVPPWRTEAILKPK